MRFPIQWAGGLLGGALFLAFSGCDSQELPFRNTSVSSPPAETQSADMPRPRPKLSTPTEEEAQQFGEDFEEAIYRSDPTIATQMIDWEELFREATAAIDATDAFREEFIQGALGAKGQFARQLAAGITKGGSFRLLRIQSSGKERRAVFRLLQPKSGVKYQELVLAKDEAGQVRAVDIYVFPSAERMSRTMRRAYLLAAAQQPVNPISRVLGKDNDFIMHANEFREMSSRIQAEDYEGAAKIYSKLPAGMQEEKRVMLLYIQAASKLGDGLYTEAIDRFREAHPFDAGVEMGAIDGFLLKQDYERALEAVNRVDNAVGGDPYMNVLRANIHLMQDNTRLAKAFAREATKEEPELVDAYWTLVSVSLAEPNFKDTAELLTKLRDELKIEIEDLRGNPSYAEFVKSPEFKSFAGE